MDWLLNAIGRALVNHAVWRALRPRYQPRTVIYVNGERSMPRKAHGNDLHDISGEIRGETALAWRFFDGSRTEWVPKSQCEWDEETKTLSGPEWLFREKGFI